MIPVVFPAFISKTTLVSPFSQPGPFEIGSLAAPFLISCAIFGIIGLLYHYKKLPEKITDSFNYIFNFEISKRVTIILILIILSTYIGFTVSELWNEFFWGDYTNRVETDVTTWGPENFYKIRSQPQFKNMLLWSSITLFDNVKVIPFIASIILLLLVYYVTYAISKKRFAGLISMLVLLQSNLFLTYDTTPAYTNFWTILYLASLFLIFKAWPSSPLVYFLSVMSKSITVFFLPMTFFVICRARIPRNRKIILLLAYVVISSIILVGIFVVSESSADRFKEFDSHSFWKGFTSNAISFRIDITLLVLLLPVVVGLFLTSKNDYFHSDIMMVMIMGLL